MNLWLLNHLVISTQGLSPKTECLIITHSIKNVIGNDEKITAEPSNEAGKSQMRFYN